MLQKSDINKLKRGIIPEKMAGEVFIVMREKISMPGNDSVCWQWSVNTSPEQQDQTIIDREDALKIIESNDMYESHKNTYGSIYEMPGNPFKMAFSAN